MLPTRASRHSGGITRRGNSERAAPQTTGVCDGAAVSETCGATGFIRVKRLVVPFQIRRPSDPWPLRLGKPSVIVGACDHHYVPLAWNVMTGGVLAEASRSGAFGADGAANGRSADRPRRAALVRSAKAQFPAALLNGIGVVVPGPHSCLLTPLRGALVSSPLRSPGRKAVMVVQAQGLRVTCWRDTRRARVGWSRCARCSTLISRAAVG